MVGLCHVCFASGVPVSITQGLIHCDKCEYVEKEREIIIPEEIIDRSGHLDGIMLKIYNKKLSKDMALDRLVKVIK